MTTTATQPKTAVAPETKLREAILEWKNTEEENDRRSTSKIWRIIKECKSLVEKQHKKDAIKTFLVSGFEDIFGEGAAKKRDSHISKILKIAFDAKEEDFDRWNKDKTSFYNAYKEFAKPQEKPAKKDDTVGAATPTPSFQVKTVGETETTEDKSWQNPDMGTEADVEKQNKALALAESDPEKAKELADKANFKTQNQVDADAKKTAAAKADRTPGWAEAISNNQENWPRLIRALCHPGDLSHKMMIDAMIILHQTSPIKLKNLLEEMMQNEYMGGIIKAFVADNPTL